MRDAIASGHFFFFFVVVVKVLFGERMKRFELK